MDDASDINTAVKSRHRPVTGVVARSGVGGANAALGGGDDAPSSTPSGPSSSSTATKSTIKANKQPTKSNAKTPKRAKNRGRKLKKKKAAVLPPEVSPPKSISNAPRLVAISPSDALDEVLDESDDLLRAARDAQSLGRLKQAQTFLYLAHARLIGLGRHSAPNDGEDGEGDASPAAAVCGGQNVSDTLARSAKLFLHARASKGMTHDAAVERRRRIQRIKNSNWNTTVVRGETASKLSSQGAGEDDEVAVPSAYPRTVVNCKHLSAERLVEEGMHAPSDDGGGGELRSFGLQEIVRSGHANEGTPSKSGLK